MATKKKNDGGGFLTGALLGAVIGVAAGALAASTPKGKKITKAVKTEAKNHYADFYAYIVPKLKNAKEMTEAEYKEFIDKSVEAYNKNKKLGQKELKALTKEAHRYWKLIKKHL